MAAKRITHSCKLCSKPYNCPLLLPCLHVFCKTCLESLQSQNEGTLTCPTCYKTSPHPPASLPRHLRRERESALSRIQEGGQIKCGSCDESKQAEAYCENCNLNVCSTCIGIHKVLKAMKSHKVTPFHSVQLESIPVPSVSCPVHSDQTLKYYCTKCSRLVCGECLLHAHKKHKWKQQLNEVGEVEKAELQSVLLEVEKAIPPLEENIKRIDTVVKRAVTSGEKITGEIDDIFRQINSAVEKRRLELLQEVKSSVTAKTTQLEIQKEGLEKLTAGLRLALDSGKEACNEYSSVEVLAVKTFIKEASTSFLGASHSEDHHFIDSSALRVAINPSKVLEVVSTLGSILTSSPHPPLCSLVGINPMLAIGVAKGCESTVLLQTRDSKGEDVVVGGAKVRGRIINRSTDSEGSECEVNDLDDGRYEISFNNLRIGKYQLHITINGVGICDSPFTINVRDYTAIKHPIGNAIATYDSTTHIDIDYDNTLYISTKGSIEIYKSGDQRTIIPQTKLGGSNFRGIAVDQHNGVMFIACADTNQIIKATLDGEVIASVGKEGSGELEFQFPYGLCLKHDNGILVVGDHYNKRVQILGSDLSFIRSIPCQSKVYGVAVDSTGNIHAAASDRIKVFSITGEKITEYGTGRLTTACGVTVFTDQLCRKGTYSLVTNERSSDKAFLFDWHKDALVHSLKVGCTAVGVTINQEGDIYLCCWKSNKVLKF